MASEPTTEKLSSAFFQSGARIAGMWPIWGLSDVAPDAFREAFEFGGLPEPLASLVPEDVREDDDIDWEEFDAGEFACSAYNAGLHGFIVVGEHPVLTATSAQSASSSWGHYRSKAFYGETVEDAITQVIAWAEQLFTSALAKFGQVA